MGIVLFANPMDDEFLKDITISKHTYTASDKMSKIAYKHYGEASLWWVIAWFNGKPTDFHCTPGDIILVPHPLEEVLAYAIEKRSL